VKTEQSSWSEKAGSQNGGAVKEKQKCVTEIRGVTVGRGDERRRRWGETNLVI